MCILKGNLIVRRVCMYLIKHTTTKTINLMHALVFKLFRKIVILAFFTCELHFKGNKNLKQYDHVNLCQK